MEIHLPKLIPGIFCLAVSLFGFRLIAGSVRGEYALLGGVLAAVVFLYGLRLVWVWLEERREERKEMPSREELQVRPWLRSRAWRRREIVFGNPVGGAFLLLAYLFFGAPAVFFFWLGIAVPTTRSGENLLFPGLLMGSVLSFIVIGLTYWRLRYRRYGDSVCRLITLPGVVGGWLKADVECALSADPDNTVVVRLKNMVQTSKRLVEVWRMEQRIVVPVQAEKRIIVNVRLQIPRAPAQRIPPLRPGFLERISGPVWLLEVEKKVPGIDFFARFAVPVYGAPETPILSPPGQANVPDSAGHVVAVATVLAAAAGLLAIVDEVGSLAGLYRPSAEWMTSERLQREFDAWSRNGYYPPRIEGGCGKDGERFRADWKPLPPNTGFLTWWGITRMNYERKNREYAASGFSLESTTQYTDCSGIEKVQATWVRK
ncbi:MAG: hypothetical protein HY017_03815 [Betaproteobacteria bacterium]|nr:hypothetical protein [Betaproteobacteria bacterium]